ncbi:tachykinin-4 isoform X2 [Sigmodon hispidus]
MLTMLPLLAVFLLIGPSVCTTAGKRKELALGKEEESWVTVNLKGIPLASIELQLQEMKRSRTRQFYGLMGKRVEGTRPMQPRENTGYQLGQMMQDLLGVRGLSIEGTCRQETHHQSAGSRGAVAREGLQQQRDSLIHQQHVALSLDTEEDDQGSE